jgi:hypothetical protein
MEGSLAFGSRSPVDKDASYSLIKRRAQVLTVPTRLLEILYAAPFIKVQEEAKS